MKTKSISHLVCRRVSRVRRESGQYRDWLLGRPHGVAILPCANPAGATVLRTRQYRPTVARRFEASRQLGAFGVVQARFACSYRNRAIELSQGDAVRERTPCVSAT